MEILNKFVNLTKLSDDVFGGNHPNGINEGHVLSGIVLKKPMIGEQFYLYGTKLSGPKAWTSKVVEINEEENLIKTKNSTYRVDVVEIQ